MKEKQISIEGQRCIGQCIHKYWSHPGVSEIKSMNNV